MSTAVVLGGGISGLSAAFYLQKYGTSKFSKIILLEATDRFGGWIKSQRQPDGAVFECGPRSLRPVGNQGRNTLKLINDLNLEKDILPLCRTDPAAKNRFLFVNGQLHALPNNLQGLVKRQPFMSKAFIWTLLSENWNPKSTLEDETIHSFVSRRLNQEMADVLIDSMCRGIYAGDCRKLSIKSCFPDLYNAEKQYGSLTRSVLFKRKVNTGSSDELIRKCLEEKWTSYSFKNGMQQLTDALTERCMANKHVDLRTDSSVKSITFLDNGKISIKCEDEEIKADAMFSAIFSKDLSNLLQEESFKKDLNSISAVSCAVINLEYKGKLLPVEGFGHLSPSSENGPVLGVIYDSCSFPQHDRNDVTPTTRLTVMLGGAWSNNIQNNGEWISNSDLLSMATEAVSQQLQIPCEPMRSQISLLNDCIPQYHIGHSNILSNLNTYISKRRLPLYLIGSSYQGVSVNDCILNAKLAVEKKFSRLKYLI